MAECSRSFAQPQRHVTDDDGDTVAEVMDGIGEKGETSGENAAHQFHRRDEEVLHHRDDEVSLHGVIGGDMGVRVSQSPASISILFNK